VDVAFRAIQPLFLSTPINFGGLGLPAPSIGTLLSAQGILNGIFQLFFFAKIHDRWGSKKTFIAGISTAIPSFIMFPVANTLARTQGYSIAVWAAIALQTISGVLLGLSYGQCSLHNL
jgi:MFS family permease